MNWKRIFHLALPLAVFFTYVLKTQAYVYTQDFSNGFYWKSYPIGMGRFVSSVTDGALLANATSLAESKWESAVGKDLWELAPIVIGSGSGNLIRWSNNFAAETGFDASRTLAVTIRYAQGTYLEKVVIILNGGISELKQDFAGLLQKTVLHEMGHVIGLDHTNESGIMQASITSISALQSDDIAGANAVVSETLYRQATGYVSPMVSSKDSNKASMLSSCGTISTGIDGGGGGGSASFFISLFAGAFLALVLKRFGRRVYSVIKKS